MNRMRIQCPNCRSIYAVPESRLEGRSTVRCARCSHGFAPAPMPEDIAPPPEPPPPLAPLPVLTRLSRAEPEPAPKPRSPTSRWLPIAWTASIATVAALLLLLMLDHRAIAAAWPPALRLYRVVGLG